jgi:tellurite resistance protein TerC
MRGTMIALGAALLHEFAWLIYVFGAFLVLAGVKMLVRRGDAKDPTENAIVRLARRGQRFTEHFHGQRFFVRAGTSASQAPAVPGAAAEVDRVVEGARRGALLATPLLLALVVIELTDVLFAVDSIPAVFALTTDPFLVFTSNVLAMLGLRSLYFALARMIDRFAYLEVALALVLVVVGVKMLAQTWLAALLGPGFTFYILGLVLFVLATGVIASLLAPSGRRAAGARRSDREVAEQS